MAYSRIIKNKNNRIAKNTLFLYLRQAITITIALFASRLLLQKLGIESYGLYGLIGSILSLFSALRGLFSSTIQRFINIEQSTNNIQRINLVFNLGIIIHLILAIIFAVCVETAGLLMIPHLNIKPEELSNAFWILQFSTLSVIFTILTIPYDAIIIANERFKAFATISIIESVLKLLIIFALSLSPISKVVFYAFLYSIVALIVRFINSIYCRINFKAETKFKIVNDKLLFKNISSFAGWQLLGNLGYALSNSGTNFILNHFGGIVTNAARAIAYQIMGVVEQSLTALNSSFQPQTMITYANSEYKRAINLTIINSKIQFSVCLIITILVILYCRPILKLWLVDIPPYSISFVQAMFSYILIRSLHGPIDTIFKASGNIKKYQICEFCFMALNLPISYIIIQIGAPYYSIFLVLASIEILSFSSILMIAQQTLNIDVAILWEYIYRKALLCILVSVAIIVILYSVINSLNQIYIWISICISIITIPLLVLFLMFSKKEISAVYKTLKH